MEMEGVYDELYDAWEPASPHQAHLTWRPINGVAHAGKVLLISEYIDIKNQYYFVNQKSKFL